MQGTLLFHYFIKFKPYFVLKEEGPKQRLIKEQPFTSAPATAGMNMSQELNASQISPILAAIIALLIGYLIGKFIL